MTRNVLIAAFAMVLLVALGIHGYRLLSDRQPTPEELFQTALHAATPEQREAAAVALGQSDGTTAALRKLLAETQTDRVRAAVLQGLAGQWDYESMPELLAALEDDSEIVRIRAHQAIRRMLGIQSTYRPRDPPGQQSKEIRQIHREWTRMKDSPLLEEWKARNRQSAPHENASSAEQ